MLTDENLKAVSEIFARRMEVVTEHTLQLVGERIKKIQSIGPDEAHLLARLSDVGADAEEIKRYLARATEMNVRDVDTIFKTFAKANYEFMAPYYTARGIEQIAFADNIELQRLIRAEAEVTKGTFRNLSQNAGVTLAGKDGQVLNLSIEEAYQNVVDLSISKVKAGVSSVDAELRSTMKGFADSGIRTINWESGVSRSMYGATRMNLTDGVRQLNMSVRKQTGEEFGADGYEISAHAVCAPDHVPIQGEQYTKHDFEQMDSGLDRPIGTCNCGHYIFPIVMGVSHRTYSREDLDRYTRENTEAHIEIDGKKYTSYEVSQLQRRCEANIRNAKNEMKIFQAAGDKDGVIQAQQKLTRAQDKYDSISRQSGFGTHISRTNV